MDIDSQNRNQNVRSIMVGRNMARDWDWVKPAAWLVGVQYFCATIISAYIGFPNKPQLASYCMMALVLSALGGLVLFLRYLWKLWEAGNERPIAHIVRNSDRAAVVTYFIGFQLIALQIGALTWLKEMIPHLIPYWADPLLANLDRAIFHVDAWQLVPQSMVGWFDVLYISWAPFKFFALILMIALPASELKTRAMLSYFLTVGLLGVAGEYILSSGGPLYYDRLVGGAGFADLGLRVREHAPIAFKASEYLWQSYLSGDTRIGNGISAMPSMHVATTTWAALALSAVWRKSRIFVWAYCLAILVGSVALGWHYLSDGLVGGGGAILFWRLAPRLSKITKSSNPSPLLAS